jgi:hypothetical protein
MDAGVFRLIAAGVIGAHGIGHVLGWLPAWGIARFDDVSSRSWLVSLVAGEPVGRWVAGLVFLIPTLGFVVVAAGLLTEQPWWRAVAVACAAVSLLATAVFPQALPTGSTIGSVALNGILLFGVLVAGWGAEAAI